MYITQVTERMSEYKWTNKGLIDEWIKWQQFSGKIILQKIAQNKLHSILYSALLPVSVIICITEL